MDNRPSRNIDGLAQLLGALAPSSAVTMPFRFLDFQPFMAVLEPNVRSRDAHERGVHLVTRLILDGLDGHANRALGRRNVRDDALAHPGVLGPCCSQGYARRPCRLFGPLCANLRGTYVDCCYDLV